MIAYEELQKALARWKARRSGVVDEEEVQVSPDPDLTPGPRAIPAAATDPQGAPDSTSELELTDAEVSEA